MKHITHGTFIGGAGELGLGALPLADWRLEPVTKNVRSAVLFLPQKLLGIHQREELADVVAAIAPHMKPAERGGLPGVDYQIPLPLAGVSDDVCLPPNRNLYSPAREKAEKAERRDYRE